MTNLDKAIIGRIEKQGQRFEMFLDPEKTYAYLEGRKKDVANIAIVEEVYKDAKKGERQSENVLKSVFGTSDSYVVLKEILEHGEIQLTTEQKRKMIEERKKQIITIISREAIDARTNSPIPYQRIELALEQAKISIDPFKKAEEQIENIIKQLKPILPIKIERIKIALKVPANYAITAYKTLKSYNVVKEEWADNGDLLMLLDIPAGMQSEIYEKVAKITHGEAQIKIVK